MIIIDRTQTSNTISFIPSSYNPTGSNIFSDGPEVPNMVEGAFAGAVAIGNFVYFVPYNADFMLRYDCDTQEIEDFGLHPDLDGVQGKFRGAVVIEEHIVFVPYNADVVGIYDTKNDVFDVFDLPQSLKGKKQLFSGGAAIDGNKVVFAPSDSSVVGVFEIDLVKIRKIRDDKDNNLPLILGLSLGLGLPILIVVMFYIYKASKK